MVLKEARHTNDFIASQVENAVIFYFFGRNLFSFSNVVINPECVFCRLSLPSYSLLSLEEVFPYPIFNNWHQFVFFIILSCVSSI